MSWEPNPTVTISGASAQSVTLDGLSIAYGTSDPTEAMRAGFASLTLISELIELELMDRVEVRIATSTGSAVIFTGEITDLSKRLITADYPQTQAQLMSPLAKYARRTAGSLGFPAQLDGERIGAIFAEAQSITWLEAGGTWATAVGTWADLDGILGQIDSGNFDLASFAAAVTPALELAGLAALSGSGWLGESPDGKLNYQSSTGRAAAAAAGWLDLEAGQILIDSIGVEYTTGSIVNDATVTDAAGTPSTYSDAASIAAYGRSSTQIDTQLALSSDADLMAQRVVELYARPRPYLQSVTVVMSELTDPIRDQLITGLKRGLPIRINGLPSSIGGDPWAGFVEGWQWRISKAEALLTLSVSDYALSVPNQSWRAIPAGITWATISGSPTWADVEIIS